MTAPNADPLADALAIRIAEVRRDIAQAEIDTASLRKTLAEVQGVKVVRSDYACRETFALALATKRATVREVRQTIKQRVALLAQYAALMDEVSPTPRARFN